jgi:branched-chain amino acid transport system ATP-binding protein
MTYALRTEGLSKSFGAFKANSDITLAFDTGARHAIIGPNGAGKTTFINLLTGVFPASAGDVYLDEQKVSGMPQHERVKRGMTRTFQINTLFPGLTVLESVTLACCERAGVGSVWWRTAATATAQIDEAREILSRLRSRPGPRCCCSTSLPRAFPPLKARICSRSSPLFRGKSRSSSSSTT